MSLAIGQQVHHADYGAGIVRGISGETARVLFHILNGIEIVRLESLQPSIAARDAAGTARAPRFVPAASVLVAYAEAPALDRQRLAIECLRQGLPPPGKLLSWTVGHAHA